MKPHGITAMARNEENIKEIILGVIESGYHGILIILAGYMVYEFKGMSQSIQELNKNVAVLIEKLSFQASRIDKLESQVIEIQRRRNH